MEPNTISSRNVSPRNSRISKALLIAVFVLILILGIFFLQKNKHFLQLNKNQSFTSEKVNITDNNKEVSSGFPANLPIDTYNISESKTINYPEKNATLFSTTYYSQKSPKEIFKTYGEFFKNEKYVVSVANDQGTPMNYQATIGDNDLSVLITPQANRTLVQIGYLVRQQ